jgi:predicted nucleotidyltransferase
VNQKRSERDRLQSLALSCYDQRMKREDAMRILKKHRKALQSRSVRRAALFGSTARGEAGPRSDVDILIELEPDLLLDAFTYAGIKQEIADLFDGPVDVVNRAGLKPHLRSAVIDGAIYAF